MNRFSGAQNLGRVSFPGSARVQLVAQPVRPTRVVIDVDSAGTPRQTGAMLKAQPYAVEAMGAPETPAQISVSEAAKALLPVAKEILDTSATEDVEVLKAKIRNHRRMRDMMPPGPARVIYQNEIDKLKAKLRAAEQAKRVELESQQATREWRVLGYTLTGTGVFVGIAGALALLSIAGSFNRTNRGPRGG